MAYKLRVAYSYNMSGYCHKTAETPPTFILVLFISFIFIATTCTAKTEKYIVISTGEYFPFS